LLRSLEGPVGLILVLIIVAIFAGPKLPGAAKGIAQAIKVFRKEVTEDKKPEDKTKAEDADKKSDAN
jgi:sec-independent protein translocase protein TatA